VPVHPGFLLFRAILARSGKSVTAYAAIALERNRFRLNRSRSISFCWSMIFSEDRYPLFRIVL